MNAVVTHVTIQEDRIDESVKVLDEMVVPA